jgi:hypothetical protein
MGMLTSRCREDAAVRLDHGQQLIVAVQLEVGDIGRRPAVDDQLVQDLELLALLHLLARRGVAVHGTCEAHPEIRTHAILAHHTVQVLLVPFKLEARHETKTPQAEGQNGRHDALEEPGCEENGAVAAEGQNQVEVLRLGPAQVGGPVLEHSLETRVEIRDPPGAEPFRVAQLGVHVNVDTDVGPVAWGLQQEEGQFAGEQDQLVVARLGHDHNVPDGALDGLTLELPGHLAHDLGRLHQARVRHVLVVLDLLEDLVDVDGVIEAVVVEAGRLERRESGSRGLGGNGTGILGYGEAVEGVTELLRGGRTRPIVGAVLGAVYGEHAGQR